MIADRCADPLKPPRGEGSHLHVHSWGEVPSLALVREAAVCVGFGSYVGSMEMTARLGEPMAYGVKTVLQGTADGPGLPIESQDFLILNGGRLGHATRGFWRNGPGLPVQGWRAAFQCVRRLHGDAGLWVVTRHPE